MKNIVMKIIIFTKCLIDSYEQRVKAKEQIKIFSEENIYNNWIELFCNLKKQF